MTYSRGSIGTRRWGALVACGSFALVLLSPGQASSDTTVTTANGTWVAYPGAQSVFQTQVQQPINADGSSSFKSNNKAVIPVKFGLSAGTGPLVFESIYSNSEADDD